MTTLREICTALGPDSLERYPQLPLAHRKVISALQQCHSGRYGHSLYQCQTCGGPHRVHPACGNRHCPPCQQHTTPPGLQHHLDTQLPGPHCLLTCTVPESLRPCIRSHQRPASQAMFHASALVRGRGEYDAPLLSPPLPTRPRPCCTPPGEDCQAAALAAPLPCRGPGSRHTTGTSSRQAAAAWWCVPGRSRAHGSIGSSPNGSMASARWRNRIGS